MAMREVEDGRWGYGNVSGVGDSEGRCGERTRLPTPGVVREGRGPGRVLHVPAGCPFLGDGDAAREGRDGDELEEGKEVSCHGFDVEWISLPQVAGIRSYIRMTSA